MIASARCPASCGELVQGWINDKEMLISCPINWYSEVQLSLGRPASDERPNMRRALLAALKYLQADLRLSETVRLRLNSTIPVAKGMASSTADIAATIAATANWLNHPLSAEEIAQLCIKLEPSDSTIFPQITLFDHLKGTQYHPLGDAPQIDIIILEPNSRLTTADYRQTNYRQQLRLASKKIALACQKVTEGCRLNDPTLIGEGATLSAIENQKILPKPGFEQLLKIAQLSGVYGLNVAHSGTVVGLLYNRQLIHSEEILDKINTSALRLLYPQRHNAKLISGGVK